MPASDSPSLLEPGCPRCVRPLDGAAETWSCRDHGPTVAVWRAVEASYDAFAVHLDTAGLFPTYLPWPMSPGWHVSDFAVVAPGPGGASATLTCSSGSSELDGPVDVLVVSEEPGTGLGARCAGLTTDDPRDAGDGPPLAWLRVDSATVPVWAVSTATSDEEFDRFVVVGEAAGRWLWLVLRPASAMLLLREEWILRDVSGIGPPLVELAFGGPAPTW